MLTKAALIAYITITAQQHGLDPDLALAVAEHESHFRTTATSHKGAIGIFQIMPHVQPHLTPVQIRDPATNVKLGVQMLVEFRKICVHKKDLQWLTCYNAGPTGAKRIKNPAKFIYVTEVAKILKRIKHEKAWQARKLQKYQQMALD
jgi:soluble lytic murein transglycosylase-like protein